jgi:molybdopterin molybdotransferase
MTTYEEALKIIAAHTQPLDVQEQHLFDSIGYVLAEDINASSDIPQTNRAAPDGYAVRAADIKSAAKENPVALRIIGTVRAGFVSKKQVRPGTAMRIMTGSVVPDGADCVVRFEDTDEPGQKNGPNPADPQMVRIFVAEKVGSNIGTVGHNVHKGSRVLIKGSLIGPAQLSSLTAIGKEKVRVFRRPIVAIIATGDELVPLGQPLSPGQVYNSNARAVAAAVIRFGGIPKLLGIAKDRENSLIAKLRKALSADVVITTGGVSKGDYDIVRLLIGKMGKVLFSTITMGPGASTAFGLLNATSEVGSHTDKPIFALSGPPSGALINCETLVRPGLLRMRGFQDVKHPTVLAESTDSISRKMNRGFVRWTYLKRTDNGFQVTLNPPAGAGTFANMASANSLTIIPQGVTINGGDLIEVMPLDWQCL